MLTPDQISELEELCDGWDLDDDGPRTPHDRGLVTSERDWLTDPDDDRRWWDE